MDTTALLVLGAMGLGAFPRIKARLDLSRAKHPSLGGHSRLSSRLARLLPAYDYDDAKFFGVDGAPEAVAGRRREAFMGLAETFRKSRPNTLRMTAEAQKNVSDLQFTAAYRVPFQFSRFVRQHLQTGGFVASSSGVKLTDLDGNEAYDLAGSYGVNVFGYDFYKECLDTAFTRARELGPVLGPYHPVVVDNVRRLREISGHDEVSFHMSGTEAVMQAVRLARYHTGKSHLVRFCGAYHGWWDDVQPGVGNPSTPRATYTLKDLDDGALRVIASRSDIACVLVNPLQALHPNAAAPSDSTLLSSNRRAGFDRSAYAAWLRRLREVCAERGIPLIFDEVFLGFRLARGGAQEYFGVRADLVTYGKTVAGGLPIGVVCGRRDLMKRFRDDRPSDICFARGTFNAHPYVMAAMSEFMARLDTPEVARIYRGLDEIWNARAEGLNERMRERDLPVRVANMSTVWTVLYTEPSCYNWMFQYYLRAHGLALSWVGTGRFIFSLNYQEGDWIEVADRFEAAASRMKADGWWWQDRALTNRGIHRRILREILAARFAGRN
jgi:glutamate-1-semialdehyde 2,1-aminomutase